VHVQSQCACAEAVCECAEAGCAEAVLCACAVAETVQCVHVKMLRQVVHVQLQRQWVQAVAEAVCACSNADLRARRASICRR